MDGFNFTVFLSCEKPSEYSCVDACESWSTELGLFYKGERTGIHRDQ